MATIREIAKLPPKEPSQVEKILNKSLATKTDIDKAKEQQNKSKSNNFVSGGGGGSPAPPPQEVKSPGIIQAEQKQASGQELSDVDRLNLQQKNIQKLRQEAGTKGKNLGYVREIGILQRYQNQQNNIRTRENVDVQDLINSVTAKKVDTRKELPFEKITRVIPETAGKVSSTLIRKSPLRNIDVEFPDREVPLKQTISSSSQGKLIFKGSKQKLPEAVGQTVQGATALGQFAIPYVGEALFLGLLLEKPILAPNEFKQEFINNPTKTAVLYGAGLISVAGGVNRALKSFERRALNKAIDEAKTTFIAKADSETLAVLSNTKIGNKNFLSRSQIRNVENIGQETFSKGVDITLNSPQRDKIEMLVSRVFTKSKNLEGAEARRIIPAPVSKELRQRGVKRLEFVKDIKGEVFEVAGGITPNLRVVYDTRSGFNILNGKLVSLSEVVEATTISPKLIKSQVIGVISPTQAEDLFKVIAGSKKLRIYKSGGVNYVFDPRIEGWLKIKGGKSFTGSSGTVVIRNLSQRVAGIVATQRKIALQQAKKQLIKPEPGLIQRLKPIKRVAKASQNLKVVEKEPSTIPKVGFKQQLESQITKSKPRTKTFVSSSASQSERTQSSQASRSAFVEQTKERQKQIPLPITGTKSASRSGQSFRTMTGLKNLQRVRQDQGFKIKSSIKIKQIPRLKNSPGAKIPSPLSNLKKNKPQFKKVSAKPLEKFDVFVRKKGKLRRINPTPLRESEARDIGAFNISRTLRAGFLTKRTSRPGLARIKSSQRGSFNRLSKQLAPSKRIKGFIVEKRKFRLDTALEKRDIQLSRREKRGFKARKSNLFRKK